MAFHEILPAPDLHPFVDRFWMIAGMPDAPAQPHLILPDGCIDLMIHVDRGGFTEVVGTMTHAAVHDPKSDVGSLAAVRFKPGGITALFGFAAHLVTDRVLAASTLGIELGLPRCVTAEDTLRRVERVLRTRAQYAPAPDPLLAHALSSVALPTATLARDLGCSRQHLRRLFVRSIGIGPKTLSRVVRMQRATGYLQDHRDVPLAHAAIDLGYFDQAHMARDFRLLAGVTAEHARQSPGSIFPIRSLYGGVPMGP